MRKVAKCGEILLLEVKQVGQLGLFLSNSFSLEIQDGTLYRHRGITVQTEQTWAHSFNLINSI